MGKRWRARGLLGQLLDRRTEVWMAIRLDVVGIAVRDMAASLSFYRLLGLHIPQVP